MALFRCGSSEKVERYTPTITVVGKTMQCDLTIIPNYNRLALGENMFAAATHIGTCEGGADVTYEYTPSTGLLVISAIGSKDWTIGMLFDIYVVR